MSKPGASIPLFDAKVVSSAQAVSPKRPSIDEVGSANIFPYYAGFSFEWAKREVTRADSGDASVVLDPWNGSGTTTLAAASLGIRSIGIDLNPAANIIAEARYAVAAGRVADVGRPPVSSAREESTVGLQSWFTERSAARLSQWTRHAANLDKDSRALPIVSVFRAVRALTKSFEGSNPTWVRRARSADELIDVLPECIDTAVLSAHEEVISSTAGRVLADMRRPLIMEASAGRLPIQSGSINCIVTSPPYLTRIDYGVAYSRELATLGVDLSADRSLRAQLMGTTLIRSGASESSFTAGELAVHTLNAVRSHSSKDSSGYYRKQFEQYLHDLRAGILEISRVASSVATMTVVVQDSYYKDIEVRLADIFVEEAKLNGWTIVEIERFNVTRLLTTMNTPARAYEKGAVAESVLRFKRSSSAGA